MGQGNIRVNKETMDKDRQREKRYTATERKRERETGIERMREERQS